MDNRRSRRIRRVARRASPYRNRNENSDTTGTPTGTATGTGIVVDIDQETERLCIDLTEDDDTVDEDVVDLTSPSRNDNNNSIVIIGSTQASSRVPGGPINLNESDDELPSLSGIIMTTPPEPVASKPKLGFSTPLSNPTLDDDPTPGRAVSCPICLDNYTQIRSSKRSLMSTICGHVFCDECINVTIRDLHACPTCRRKLTSKQVHKLFL